MKDSVDEQPKQSIAKKVISGNQKYFLPQKSREVEAETLEDAIEAGSDDTSENAEEQKVGDGK